MRTLRATAAAAATLLTACTDHRIAEGVPVALRALDAGHAHDATLAPPPLDAAPPADAARAIGPMVRQETTERGITLGWLMTASADHRRLRVDFDVTNHTRGAIYVADHYLVEGNGDTSTRTDKLIVKNGDPGMVTFALASSWNDMQTNYSLTSPTFRRLNAGKRLAHSFEMPVPLKAWHPDGGVKQMRPDPSQAELYVDAFVGHLPTADQEGDLVVLHVGPAPLPR